MNADKNNKKLDELIARAVSRDKLQFDFNKWKQTHKEEIEIFQSQEEPASAVLGPSVWRIPVWRKVGYLAATFLIISSWVACFVLSGKVSDLKNELELARRDVAPGSTDDSATINLYLREHKDVVARHAAFSSALPQPAQMRVDHQDILYYEFLDDELERMHPGIIIRGPLSEREIDSPEAPAISNGHTLKLAEARETTDFELRAPARLYPGYCLDQIRRIEGRDALQLLYTDGINSISLFEQPLDGRRRLEPQDFREYAVYRNKGQAGGTILAWRDDALSYVLIGTTEMSRLMDMAQSISAGR
ncbi:MAG: hypothetical protein JSW59_12260 [Phycisphaerales bacterium]|nr:MAG: hypothetical protein JSW59_12260 [Phycisphaerales bacterium]